MKPQKIVFYQSGANVGTYSPLCFLENFNNDINEKTNRCVSFDNDMLVETDMYVIKVIQIPEWMDEAYYLNHHIGYKFAVGLGGDYVTTLSKVAMSNFLTLGETYQYFIGVYMQGNTKSNFKLSIRAQIENWLNTDNNKYRTPLSENQFSIASKYVRLYEAKQIATHIYWDR
jgi:hypothetical protein